MQLIEENREVSLCGLGVNSGLEYSLAFPQNVKHVIKPIYSYLLTYKRMKNVCPHKSMNIQNIGRRQWHPTPVLLPRKSHGWRSLVGCIHGVAKSQTRLSDFTFTFHFHALEKEMLLPR